MSEDASFWMCYVYATAEIAASGRPYACPAEDILSGYIL